MAQAYQEKRKEYYGEIFTQRLIFQKKKKKKN